MIDLDGIPKSPGCYLFKNSQGTVIYVGKAKNLSKRVKSYFQSRDHDEKTKILVENIKDVEFFITDNEVEALVLENNLIKKHWPKYNINLKDSKGYAYIEITNEEYPRLLVSRKKEAGGEFYGPFVSAANRDYVLDALIKTFRIRTCKRLPKRECLRYALGLCSGPCTNRISKKEYSGDVESARMVLKGKNSQLIDALKKKMDIASKEERFEVALNQRNKINAVSFLNERQKVERQKGYDEDIINYIVHDGIVYLSLFNVKKGILLDKHDFEFDESLRFFEQFLMQYYTDNKVPKEIIIPKEIDPVMDSFLKKIRGSKVKLVVPKKGEKWELLEMVKKNIEANLFGDSEKLKDLRDKLNLNETPTIIECFDISHLSGTDTVGSMVQFRNGKMEKSNYRKFRVKSVGGIDDYAAIKEVVKRRYYKLKVNGIKMPNLVVIDGGKGQLSAAISALDELGVKIPIISLAKREEEVFIPGKSESIKLNKKGKALKLLMNIRDEAHRFAITYNKLLRKKKIWG